MNAWSDVKDNNGAKTVGASLAFKPGKATIIANYLWATSSLKAATAARAT